MGLLIKNGKVFLKGEFQTRDVLITENRVAKIEAAIEETGHHVIDANYKIVIPGMVDLHVHLREPGGEHKETIETGTLAAAKGGFTTIAPMPNTSPVPDSLQNLEMVNKKIQETAHIRVLPYASITQQEKGETLVDFDTLKKNGAFAFSDDGVGVQSAGVMLEAMREAAKINATIVAHCEENTLINNGAVHDGEFARAHGINGIPNVCEAVQIARDVLLAELADCHYHVCHVSTKESVRAIRDAKRAGIKVTAEVTPHHLLLTEKDIPGLDTNYKMNPPLRSEQDRQALIEGLLDGTIDFIATDHAPHAAEEKAKSLQEAPFGIVGLETAFPLLYTELVKKNVMTLEQLVEFMTVKPSKSFKLPFGEITVGEVADIAIIDLEASETIDTTAFASKGKNTPFNGWVCQGWPVGTIVEGKVVWEKGSVTV